VKGSVGSAEIKHFDLIDTPQRRRHQKITAADVTEIRRRYAKGGFAASDLCKYYGISANTVLAIVSRRTWRDVL
jgi:hypothetical protein